MGGGKCGNLHITSDPMHGANATTVTSRIHYRAGGSRPRPGPPYPTSPAMTSPISSVCGQGWLSKVRRETRSANSERHLPAERWMLEVDISSRRSRNMVGQEDRLARAMTHTGRPANELPATPPQRVHAPTPTTQQKSCSAPHLDQNKRGCRPPGRPVCWPLPLVPARYCVASTVARLRCARLTWSAH